MSSTNAPSTQRERSGVALLVVGLVGLFAVLVGVIAWAVVAFHPVVAIFMGVIALGALYGVVAVVGTLLQLRGRRSASTRPLVDQQ